MALEMKMNLRLSQQLIMTPQLQQAIKLLQLNHLEMVDQIQQELVENPVLEEAPEAVEESPRELPDVGPEPSLTGDESKAESDIDWAAYLSRRSVSDYRGGGGVDDEDRELNETTVTRTADLSSHLEWQLQMVDLDSDAKVAGLILIGYINDDGYLSAPLAEIAAKEKLDPEFLEWVLEHVQSFDPPGVGARDLPECLTLQLSALGIEDSIVHDIIREHLPDLERHDYKRIAKALDCDLGDVVEAVKVIQRLEPKPGRPFASERPQYISPDIYVIKDGDEFIITLNDDGLPKLKISNYYKSILQNGAKAGKVEHDYIQEKMRGAVWLIRSIHQRQRTIFRVAESIVKFQREFLEQGVNHLKPLILRDVAEDIGMHESTISRVTTNKYMHTPQGIFELKYFFNSGIGSEEGAVASESVKNMIGKIVAEENARKPLSDQRIVELLAEREGLNIARRTVAKYREMLGIFSSTKRKRLY